MLAKMQYVNIRLILTIFILSCIVLKSECTNLYINDPVVMENKEFNITCNSTELSTFSVWTRVNAMFYVGNNASGDCVMQGNEESIIRCYHDEPYTYIVTVLPHSDQHGEQWSCSINTSRDTLILNVSVPVKNVTLGVVGQSTLSLNENINTEVSCVSSYGRPRANIMWYMKPTYQSTTPTYLYGNEGCITLTKYPDLTHCVNCTKNVRFNRTYNGWYLVCTAENIDNYSQVALGILKLNVTYTTNMPIIKSCTNNGVYKVLQNHIGNLTCSVDGGNPAGIFHWNCTGDLTEQRGPNNNVSQTIVWAATQTQYCTCNSTNIAGSRSTSVYIDVLYPPILSDILNQTVFEGDSAILQCDVIRANPPVYMTRWTSNKHNVTSTTLSLPNVTRHDMIYTCTVYNTMDPSCHHVVQGNTSKSVRLEVLYPPSVNITSGKSFTVQEGDTFKYACPVVPGNPTTTNVTWKRLHDTKVLTSSELLIHNVSRYDNSVYTCYVTNMMVHSNGSTKLGHASAGIRLIVQYSASVTYFHVQNYPDNTSIVLMEHTSIRFECRLQGNPTADVKIYKFENEVKSSNTDKMLYDTSAACFGKPVLYSCHGHNILNNKPSTREVQLLVRCKPRPDPNVNLQYNETSAINHTVTLSYTALAYPHPTFIWYRHGSSKDINDSRIIISSFNLNTNLTISHVQENDFGQYVVNATNDVGSNITYMFLKPQGVPEVPTNFKHINSTTTESIIVLNWTPGFNNGLEQTFTLLYRKQPDGTWQSIHVKDTGQDTILYNITGLTPDTNYDVILYAFNDLGKSRSNVTLSCRTNIAPGQTMTSTSQDVTGMVVGTICGVVVLCGILLSVFIYRRRFANTSKSTSTEPIISTLPVTYENLKIDIVPNEIPENMKQTSGNQQSETNIDHTYEGLSARNEGKEKEYSSLIVDNKTDAKVVYENLKI